VPPVLQVQSTTQTQAACCREKLRKSLQTSPLPDEEETEAYLRKEFDWIPTDKPLTLITAIWHLVLHARGDRDLTIRAHCILAIWGSKKRALTARGILQALSGAASHFGGNEEVGMKRIGWEVSIWTLIITWLQDLTYLY